LPDGVFKNDDKVKAINRMVECVESRRERDPFFIQIQIVLVCFFLLMVYDFSELEFDLSWDDA